MPFTTQRPQSPRSLNSPRPAEAGMPQPDHPRESRASVYISWKQHESVGIDLSHVPRAASTHDIYEALKKEGSIVRIDLYETSDGRSTTRGFVRFRLVFFQYVIPH